jgi:hypothetical protein
LGIIYSKGIFVRNNGSRGGKSVNLSRHPHKPFSVDTFAYPAGSLGGFSMSRILTPSLANYLLIATKVRDIEEAFKEAIAFKNTNRIVSLEREWKIAREQLRFAKRAMKGEQIA